MKSYRNLLAIIASLIFCLNIFGQQEKANPLIIQTSMDEAGGFLTPISDEHFLLTIARGHVVTHPNDINGFYDYTNITYLVSDELELIDSLHFDPVAGYGTRVAQIIPLPDGNYLALGNAYDSVSNDFQLYLRWFDAELGLIRDSLAGTSAFSEQYYAALLNQAGNIVISGGYGNTDTAVLGHLYFLEMNPEGNLLQHYTDSSMIYRFGLVQSGVDEKYYQGGGMNSLFRLNTDFTLDTIIELDGQLEVDVRNFGKLNDSTFYYVGNYYVQGSPPPILDMDMAFQPFSMNGELFPLVHFGAVDTLDFYNSMTVSDEGIFLVGTKHSESGPVPSWYMANKLNHNLELEYQVVYGDGVKKYRSGGAMPTADGGFLASMSVWDFIHYPGDQMQHDVVVVRYDANGQLVSTIELPAPPGTKVLLAPNPAANQVQIMDEQHCWQFAELFDQQGKLISEKRISNCRNINISDLDTGIYLIRLSDNYGKSAVARLVKE
ncbi:MAG: T9SS type A sorting domain-containing protein [Bacteroidales bacterium]|nr:T9SS type A sorting domain-containing protein [Bacteroidales bacterium]